MLAVPEINERYQSSPSDQQKHYEDYLYSRQSYNRLKKAAEKNGAEAAIEIDKAKSKLRADGAAYAAAKSTTGASAQLGIFIVAVDNNRIKRIPVEEGILRDSLQEVFGQCNQTYQRQQQRNCQQE